MGSMAKDRDTAVFIRSDVIGFANGIGSMA